MADEAPEIGCIPTLLTTTCSGKGSSFVITIQSILTPDPAIGQGQRPKVNIITTRERDYEYKYDVTMMYLHREKDSHAKL